MRSPTTAVMAVAALLLLLVLVTLSAAAEADGSSDPDPPSWEEKEEERRQVMAEWMAKHGKKFRERSEKEARFEFAKWTTMHGKKYSSAREERRRYAIFKDKLRTADQENAVFGRRPYKSIKGPFSDLTHEEWGSNPMVNGMLKRDSWKPGVGYPYPTGEYWGDEGSIPDPAQVISKWDPWIASAIHETPSEFQEMEGSKCFTIFR